MFGEITLTLTTAELLFKFVEIISYVLIPKTFFYNIPIPTSSIVTKTAYLKADLLGNSKYCLIKSFLPKITFLQSNLLLAVKQPYTIIS
jgi:hypothetical protein